MRASSAPQQRAQAKRARPVGSFGWLIFVGASVLLGVWYASRAPAPSDGAAIQAAVPTSSPAVPTPTTALATPSAGQRATPAPASDQVGWRLESDGVALTVHSVRKAAALRDSGAPDPGKVFVVLDVTVENVGRPRDVPVSAQFFRLADGVGNEYPPGALQEAAALKTVTVARGERARGTVAFEVPESGGGLTVRYATAGAFDGAQVIVLSVK